MTYIFNKENYSLIEKESCPVCDSYDISNDKICKVCECCIFPYPLKSYPCIKDERWIDGKEYEEEKDFEIVEQMEHISKYIKYARLKPNQSESQEDLWNEVTQIVYDNIRKMDGVTVKELSESFIITRKVK